MPVDPNFEIVDNPDGSCTVKDVPFFAVCEKAGLAFGEDWLDAAVAYHQADEANKSASPFHIQHHPAPGDIGAPRVKPGGMWTNTRKIPLRTRTGGTVPGAVADFLFTDREAANRAKLNQLLWRSAEIPKDAVSGGQPRFRSIALLDRHAPHVTDLPVMTVRKSGKRSESDKASRADVWTRAEGDPVLAFHEDSDGFVVLMEPEAMPNTRAIDGMTWSTAAGKGTITVGEKTLDFSGDDLFRFMDEGEKSDDKPADDTPDADSDGGGETKSVADVDFDSLTGTAEEWGAAVTTIEGIIAKLSGSDADEPADDGADEAPIDNQLGDVAFSASDDVVKLQADLEAMKAREAARDESAKTEAAYDKAADMVANRGKTREDVVKFAEGFDDPGAAAIKFAESIKAMVPARDATFEEVMGHAQGDQTVPDAVLKFQSEGEDAYAWALGKSKVHAAIAATNPNAMSLERFLEVNKPGGEFDRAPVSTEV